MNLIRILIFTFLWCASVMNGFAQKSVTYQLSTHMLDISKGQPAHHVTVTLYKLDSITDNWKQITTGKTDENGRIANLLPLPKDNSGIYKLKFETTPYFRAQNLKSIYPYVEVVFRIEGKGHYHIPITMSANGYSTYRGN